METLSSTDQTGSSTCIAGSTMLVKIPPVDEYASARVESQRLEPATGETSTHAGH
ncbi:hypothetical protein F444_16305, partial [Phytophthora nicotianae P1976]